MVISIQRHTVEEFEKIVSLPENADKLFEFIGGEIVEMSPSNPYSSVIASRINGYLFMYLAEHKIGQVTGEAGGYMVGGERYAPDVAFISYERQSELAHEGYNPNPPELAVEVASPTDTEKRLSVKIANYLAVGTTVWVVRPDVQEVEVYVPGQMVEILGINDTVSSSEILPGFELVVNDIFPPQT